MTNIGKFPVHINYGEKLTQAVPYVIDHEKHTVDSAETMTEEEFYKDFVTERGSGSFGSTGTN